MTCQEKKSITFKLREMQYQDASGRQFIVRVDDSGHVVFAKAFDQRGDEVQLKEGETIELSIAIKSSSKIDKDVAAEKGTETLTAQGCKIPEKEVLVAQVCMCPIQMGGKTYYYPC
jgi:hypothetical protein